MSVMTRCRCRMRAKRWVAPEGPSIVRIDPWTEVFGPDVPLTLEYALAHQDPCDDPENRR